MSKTAERTSVKMTTEVPNGTARRPRTKTAPFIVRCLKVTASLRVTVVLMALAILLVFFGTLAQVDQGIGTVLHRYFRTLLAWIPWQVFVRFAQVFFHVDQKVQVSGSFPFPGGWLLGGLLLANLLAAHATRFRLTWKRSGVLVLHAGLVVIMLSELITGLFAVESRMTIALGESVGFADVSSEPILFGGSSKELTFTSDTADPKQEHVVVIPASLLRPGETISNNLLPVDVEILEYWPNSDLLNVGARQSKDKDVFESADRMRWAIVSRSEGTGVDPNSREDAASVRVTLKKKDTHEPLGTHLLSMWHYPNFTVRRIEFPPQTLNVDGKTYAVSMRPKRVYKDYALKLTHFTHDKYPGTDIPKDFKSTVLVNDPARHENREVNIFMNNPLDYSHDTFYQSGFFHDDGGTVLQVVHNPGWLMPYIACVMVALGMLIHFGIHLLGFIRLRGATGLVSAGNGKYGNGKGGPAPARRDTTVAESGDSNWVLRYVPYAVLFMFVVYLCALMIPADDEGKMNLSDAGKIPVQEGGRVKPFDTLANTSLLVISNRSTFVDEKKKEHTATEWLLDVMAGGDPRDENNRASRYKVFRVENPQLLDLLQVKYRAGWRFSFLELSDGFQALEKEVERVESIDEHKRSVFDTKVLELRKHLELYLSLAKLMTPGFLPAKEESAKWKSLFDVEQDVYNAAVEGIRQKGLDMAKLRDLPPEQRLALVQPELKKARDQVGPEAKTLLEIIQAYGDGEAEKFNQAVAGYLAAVDPSPVYQTARVRTESFFDRIAPFYQCTALYVAAFGLAFLGLLFTAFWDVGGRVMVRAAFWLAVFTLLLHTWALGTRMYLQGRPPVTNLYSAAVWISWGCVLLGLTLEAIYRKGIGIIVAAVPGFLSMLLAHHLAGSGDTLEMMQAVLDTNFWLATHVTIVTFGYVATVVAGVIGLIYVLLGVLTPALDRDMGKVLGQMIYGVLCFATLLSFTGTVLGGLWADYSWGRFWGWDPKENGALIIVLWNALILHARWSGLIKQRGMAVLSIVGIMVTGWSFIGTNQLGVGLHAYGFNNTLATILVWTWFACLGLIGMGLTPKQRWLSNRLQG